MKRIYYIFNLLLILMIPALIFIGNTKVFSLSIKTKSLRTSAFSSVQLKLNNFYDTNSFETNNFVGQIIVKTTQIIHKISQ